MNSSKNDPPRRSDRIRIGRIYEDKAASFYEQEGFEIVERNWRAGHKEIDLIVRRCDLIVFVEVKGSQSEKFGHPSEWVDRRKVERLSAAALQYIAENDTGGCDLRFDVITFQHDRLEHYPNAFQMFGENG
jgi:putative endonuclease